MLKHFRIKVLLSCQDPSKLKLDRSKQEIRARVDNRVVDVVSLQDPVGALGVSRETGQGALQDVVGRAHKPTQGLCPGRRLLSLPRSTLTHGPACRHKLLAGQGPGKVHKLLSHTLC